MPRFFLNSIDPASRFLILTGENGTCQGAAAQRADRLRRGRNGLSLYGLGCCAGADLVGRARGRARRAKAAVRCAVYMAFAKGDKFEHVIQKATELGAAELVCFPSARCVSRPDEKSLKKKLERWQKIAASAAEQSRRGRIPEVLALPSYAAALERAAQAELAVCFYENEERRTFRSAVEAALPLKTAALLTGPEGGFEPEEVAQAAQAGLAICTLGRRILRCETAPLCALSALMYAAGEF